MSASAPVPTATASVSRRLWPLLLLVALIALAFALGLDDYLQFEALRQNREALLAFVAAHPVVAPVVYVAVYAAAIALSLPGGLILTLAGGFLFGTVEATLLPA